LEKKTAREHIAQLNTTRRTQMTKTTAPCNFYDTRPGIWNRNRGKMCMR